MTTCPLERALGRLAAGQHLQDLSWSCLITLYEHALRTHSPLAEEARAELLRRSSNEP